jgi:hypothetical protein
MWHNNDPPQFPVHKFLMRPTDGNELEAVRSKSLNYITAVAQHVPARANYAACSPRAAA